MKSKLAFILGLFSMLPCQAAEPDRSSITSSEPVPTGKSTVRFDIFGVGMDTGSPVSNTYKPPFAFTGTIHEVRVELK